MYHYTFDFPAGYSEFYLDDYAIKANPTSGSTSDLGFTQTEWSKPASTGSGSSGQGDISFGTPDKTGPEVSFTRQFGNTKCTSCTFDWPNTNPIGLDQTSTAFRIGWGEGGPEAEGWYPWWSGTIRLR
jgi:hypothetical protein